MKDLFEHMESAEEKRSGIFSLGCEEAHWLGSVVAGSAVELEENG